MRNLALVLNWLLLALCGVSLLLTVSRGPNPGAFVLAVPVAATLAVLHFQPKPWFVVLALLVNALVVVLVGYFVLATLLVRPGSGGPGALMWLFFVMFIAIFAFNVAVLLRRLVFRVAG